MWFEAIEHVCHRLALVGSKSGDIDQCLDPLGTRLCYDRPSIGVSYQHDWPIGPTSEPSCNKNPAHKSRRADMLWRSPSPARRPVGFIEPCLPTHCHSGLRRRGLGWPQDSVRIERRQAISHSLREKCP
jgi:hypothetical protein